MEYLVESALLTHGLKSVSNETIKKEWQEKVDCVIIKTIKMCNKKSIKLV